MQRETVKFFDGKKQNEKLQEEESQLPELNDAIRIWNNSPQDTSHFCPDVDVAWNCVKGKLEKKSVSRAIRTWYWAAASVLVVLGAYFVTNSYLSSDISGQNVLSARDGEVREVVLADGTLVWINAGGTISYDAENPRIINLEGEAFFKVSHNPSEPFIVNSSGVETKVLGTEFNVNDRHNMVTIDVVSGKVEINALNKTILATPQTRVEVSNKENTVKKTTSSDQNFLFWKTGLLNFHDSLLEDILAEINGHYKADVTVLPQLSQCKLTLSLNKMSLEESLDVIATLLKGTVNRTGSTYIIQAEPCQLPK